jgi:hypothetical protein
MPFIHTTFSKGITRIDKGYDTVSQKISCIVRIQEKLMERRRDKISPFYQQFRIVCPQHSCLLFHAAPACPFAFISSSLFILRSPATSHDLIFHPQPLIDHKERTVMPDLRSVPDDTKWQIATQYAAHMTAIYESIFRPVVQDRYNDLEQEVWMHMALYSLEIAQSLRLPVGTARNLAESLRLVSSLFFGPDYKGELIEVGNDGAVIIIRRCPVLAGDCCSPASVDGTFHRCMAFTLASQRKMNPGYSSRFVRAMCMGDRQCEIKIEPVKAQKPKPTEKIP